MNKLKNLLRKVYYLKSFLSFKSFGKNILLSKGGTFIRPREISMGSNIFINRNFHISARKLIMGNNIMIGTNLVIECDNHKFNSIGKTMFQTQNERNTKGVTIEDDVWIGANVTILSGTNISEGCIIGACSLVNKFIPPYTIAFGIPCKPIKPRFTISELKSHLQKINKQNELNKIINYWEQYNLS